MREEELARVLAPLEVGERATSIGEALKALLDRGRSAWPEVHVEETTFVERVRSHVVGERDLLDELGALQAEGLYLACACALGDEAAIERFEVALWPEVSRALSQMGIEVALRDEVLSRLREVLFFGDAGGAPPLIASYAGRGSLRSWTRSVAIHQALKMRRKDKPLVPIDDLVLEMPAKQKDPELAYLRTFYLDEFRAALGRAMATLPRRERSLLRQHYLDKMSLDAVAKAYRVHRATAARWLADAREAVLTATKAELTASIDLAPSEVDSILAFVRQQSTFGGHMSEIDAALRKT